MNTSEEVLSIKHIECVCVRVCIIAFVVRRANLILMRRITL